MIAYLTEQAREPFANVNINLHFLIQIYHTIILTKNSIRINMNK